MSLDYHLVEFSHSQSTEHIVILNVNIFFYSLLTFWKRSAFTFCWFGFKKYNLCVGLEKRKDVVYGSWSYRQGKFNFKNKSVYQILGCQNFCMYFRNLFSECFFLLVRTYFDDYTRTQRVVFLFCFLSEMAN